MDKFLIREYKGNFWQVAEVFKNGIKIADVNKFYSVTADWIIIYDTVGGTGYGYKKGEILAKIYIGNAEYSKEYLP